MRLIAKNLCSNALSMYNFLKGFLSFWWCNLYLKYIFFNFNTKFVCQCARSCCCSSAQRAGNTCTPNFPAPQKVKKYAGKSGNGSCLSFVKGSGKGWRKSGRLEKPTREHTSTTQKYTNKIFIQIRRQIKFTHTCSRVN